MQFDLLQNELLTPDEASTAPSKKRRPTAEKCPKEPVLVLDANNLPPLPDSLLSALSQPPDAEFHDAEPEGDDVTDELPTGHHKSPGAFKTISEVAAILDVPQHVLRFWESRFPQIKPIKSRGGRRYYRPEDMKILETIKHLLYKQGYTIKGAKKAFSQLKKADVMQGLPSTEAAQALSFDAVFAQMPPKSALSDSQVSGLAALRNELISLRDTLKLHM